MLLQINIDVSQFKYYFCIKNSSFMRNRYLVYFFLFSFSLVQLLSSCNRQDEQRISEDSEIFGLATPITLNTDKTIIHLEDYFNDVNRIDSIDASKFLRETLSADKKELTLECKDNSSLPVLSEMKVWVKNHCYSLLLKKSRKINKEFLFDSKGKIYKTIRLAGDFNNWTPASSTFTQIDNIWKASLLLNPGRYSYQIVVDGKWMLDPASRDSVSNGIGGYNSSVVAGNDDVTERPKLFTLKGGEKKIKIGFENDPDEIFVFWQNQRLTGEMIEKEEHKIKIKIPRIAFKTEKSFLRVWAINKSGASNDLLIPLKQGELIEDASVLDRTDMYSQVMYFLLVDRFADGNKANNFPVNDKEIAPKSNFMGGDLAGIAKKITDGFFSQLGISMLWLSPIHQNPLKGYKDFTAPNRMFAGYHGYWPTAITKIDYRFGKTDDFKNLVQAAHAKNENVILDYVANHLHEESQLFKNNPGWATQLNLPDGRKNIRLWDECRLTTWFDTYLPTLDLGRPEVIEPITDSALQWVKTFGFDGFRHDATKHVPEPFWRRLTQKLKKQILIPEKKSFYQIGETYGSRELISSYINSGELDGQFDFNLYFDARNTFGKDDASFENLKNSLMESLEYYGYHNLMGNITGNQDQARFVSLAGGGLKWDENDKETGWQRDVGVGNPSGYKKLSMLTAFITTIPGIPIIYYGDEIGMPGANDPDNRRMMKFENLSPDEISTKKIAEKLIALRRQNMALIYGDFKMIEATKKILIYSRNYFGKNVIVVFNKNATKETITTELIPGINGETIKPVFGSEFKISNNKFSVQIPAYSFEIFVN